MKKLVLFLPMIALTALFISCHQGNGKNSASSGEDAPKEEEKQEKMVPSANPNAKKPENKETYKNAEANKASARANESASEGQEDEPFPYLEKMTHKRFDDITIKYAPKHTEVYNLMENDLDADNPFLPVVERYMGGMLMMKTKLQKNGEDYIIIHSPGPSGDPAFMIFKNNKDKERVTSIAGNKLYIPGNGNVYAEGNTFSNIKARKKYTLRNGKIEEVKQPFYYAGMKTTTKTPIKLYASQKLKQEVASLPSGYPIELVLEASNHMYLIKTKFGLVGWKKVEWRGLSSKSIKGLRTASD